MSEKPILFNTEMVRAILDGRKTQTRRVIRFPEGTTGHLPPSGAKDYIYWPGGIKRAPYRPGDILWVRETWNYGFVETDDREYQSGQWFEESDEKTEGSYLAALSRYWYRADVDDQRAMQELCGRWRPSIHMPKSAARIWLQVKKVRAEHLRDITNKDAKAEGVTCETDNSGMMHRHEFRQLWDGITPPEHQWDTNPWVWVIKFEKVDPKCMCSSEKKAPANGSR